MTVIEEAPTQKKGARVRSRCIWTLLEDLNRRGVESLVLESREERNDREDRREIITAQKAGVADPDLVYRHSRPMEESLLWVADAIAGGVGNLVAHDDTELFELMPEGMREIRWVTDPDGP